MGTFNHDELQFTPSVVHVDQSCIQIGLESDLPLNGSDFRDLLMNLHPWRSVPILFGTHIDTEWRSDWKWTRIEPHVADLQGRRVLDVGCGSAITLGEWGAGAQVGYLLIHRNFSGSSFS